MTDRQPYGLGCDASQNIGTGVLHIGVVTKELRQPCEAASHGQSILVQR